MVISCNINAIGSASLTEGSVFYLDDLEFSVTLISPVDNDIIISGEKDTIRWSGGNKKITLLYSIDDGNTFKTIVTNFPADSDKYIWQVPKELLSTKGIVRIEDSNNKSIYDEHRVKFKPWHLTRIDANGDFELYEPGQDGWYFPSSNPPMWPQSWWQQFDYQNGTEPIYNIKYSEIGRPFSAAPSWWFPDWPLWVEAFRIPQCYKSHHVDFKSSIIWAFFAQRYKGCSYGFGITSLLYFYHKSSFSAVSPSLKDAGDLFSITLDTSIREVNNLFEICSIADPFYQLILIIYQKIWTQIEH